LLQSAWSRRGDPDHIDRFIAAWYTELGRLGQVRADLADDRAARLREAIRRPDLSRLAPSPLLLTVIALVHTHKGILPDARARLYEETIEILLWRWETRKAEQDGEQPRLRRLLSDAGLAEVDLKRALTGLAFATHASGRAPEGDQLADIGELQLLKDLAVLNRGSLDWAKQVVEAMKLRAGLLIERAPGVYTFPHRTFQEYLAGAHLASQADFARRSAGLLADGVFWRQVVLLAVGRLVYVAEDLDKPLALVGELCPAREADDETAWRKAWIAGEALVEMGAGRAAASALGRDLLARVQGRLADLLEKGRLSPVERASAGVALGRLGDPRFRGDAWWLPGEPLLGFVGVEAGPFWMGSDRGQDHEVDKEEMPQHEVTLPTFYIGRYPVTVAQFRAFVEDSGHVPRDRDSLRGPVNHPVVWVTWDEALTYCQWLTEKLRAWSGTREPLATLLRHPDAGGRGWCVTLPSEAEWEKAARGPKHEGGTGSDDRRRYPWGDELDPDRANYNETGVGSTSAVGSFPGGRSSCEVEDLAGNVWEWTRSAWGRDLSKAQFKYPYKSDDGRERVAASRDMPRVLRGGSFYNVARLVQCAARNWYDPDFADDDLGFRVVVSPFAL
jgi:formylglycine-generating enzyme required for sulfatase activity